MPKKWNNVSNILAVVLAAGMSRRMGVPKMALPWKNSTVLGVVLDCLAEAGLQRVRVVVGANRDEVERIVNGSQLAIEQVFNPNYENGEMMDSIRIGIQAIDEDIVAVMLVLGDQPQIEAKVVSGLIEQYQRTGARLVVPSYQMHRGHPWLIDRALLSELANMRVGETVRDFLFRHSTDIAYLMVDTVSILEDLDTPEDYTELNNKK